MAFSGVTFSKVEHTISSLPNKPKSHKVFFLCLDITIGKLASICWQITELQNALLYVCNLSRETLGIYLHACNMKKGTKDREKKILTRFSHQKEAGFAYYLCIFHRRHFCNFLPFISSSWHVVRNGNNNFYLHS